MASCLLAQDEDVVSTKPSGLTRWDRTWLAALVLLALVFGVIVVTRTACLSRSMGDLQVFLRGAWAARTGADLYSITDDNNWHYCYPPLLAVLLQPLGDAPRDPSLRPVPSLAVSAAIWYAASWLFVLLACHLLASALEATSCREGEVVPTWHERRWWLARMVPVALCLTSIGRSLGRGQVDLLLLFFMAASLAAALRGRSFRAGLWLGGAIALKVIPVFLLIYPLWRRDARWLAGSVAGAALGLFIVPAIFMGPERALEADRQVWNLVLAPGLGLADPGERGKELLHTGATDSQSILTTFHNLQHLERHTRPANADRPTRLMAMGLASLLTLLTLAAQGWRRATEPTAVVLGFGGLIALMILASPVCHFHYFAMLLPLVMGLTWNAGWYAPGARISFGLWWGLLALFLLHAVIILGTTFPGCERLRDLGLPMFTSLAMWGLAMKMCLRHGSAEQNTFSAQRLALSS